jgi:hypothetical protein
MARRQTRTLRPRIKPLEIASIEVRADLPLHAVRLEVADPTGGGFACLIGPDQVRDLILRLVNALGAFVPR